MKMDQLARLLVIAGIGLVVIGGIVYLLGRFNLPLGRLPGDLRFQVGNVTIYIPLATSILLSILLTIGLSLLSRFWRK